MFDKSIIMILDEPLEKEAVKQREGTGKKLLSYLKSNHVINEANRIFGYGNWGTEIMHLHQADKTQYMKNIGNGKQKAMVAFAYTCHLKLTVRDGAGNTQTHEDVGFGNGIASHNAMGIASAIELANKEAVTDALKRCMRFYGNKFGNSLYDTTEDSTMSAIDIERTRPVSEEDLDNLLSLASDRGVDKDWIISALKGETFNEKSKESNLPFDKLTDMTQEWLELATKLVDNYRRKEREAEEYVNKYDQHTVLLLNAATENQAKSEFMILHDMVHKQDDKKRQQELVKNFAKVQESFKGAE